MTSGAKADLGPVGIIGLVVWLIGFAIEVTADRQKSAFAPIRPTEAGSSTSGCGVESPPNYFGEITLWLGVAIVAAPVLQGWQYATLVSPVFVFVLLNFVSGVPMLERRSDREWGGQEAYEAQGEDPVLVLRPPRHPSTARSTLSARRREHGRGWRAGARAVRTRRCGSNRAPGRRPMPGRRRPHRRAHQPRCIPTEPSPEPGERVEDWYHLVDQRKEGLQLDQPVLPPPRTPGTALIGRNAS